MKKKIISHFLVAITCSSCAITIMAQKNGIPEDFQLVYSQTFDRPQDLYDFEMTDPNAWQIQTDGDNKTLALYGASAYESKVRSPFNIALIKDLEVGDFTLDVNLAQSGREYGHRDLCLFFGFQNPTNFYYVHIASVADNNANNIFIVNDEPRTNIATTTTKGTDWGVTNSWHKVRVERRLKDGVIKIYFDDMTKPIMEATDTHFDFGRVGFGSFDDTGRFDNINIWAPMTKRTSSGIFQAANQKK